MGVMIRTRVDDTFGIQALKLSKAFSDVLSSQAKGEERIAAKQAYKKRVAHLLNVLMIVTRCIGRYKLQIKRIRSISTRKSKQSDNFASRVVSYEVGHKGATVRVLFVRNPDFITCTDEEINKFVRGLYARSAVFKYSLHFRESEMFIIDDRSKIIRSYFIARFDELQTLNINGKQCILLGYGKCERLLLISSKQAKIDAVYKTFSDVLEKTSTLKLNYKL